MTPLKVISFNMQFGQTWDPANPDTAPVDLSQTVAAIRKADADVVFLQEVEQVDPSVIQLNPPPNFNFLKNALPAYHTHFSYPTLDPRELPFGFGLAIFSKLPLHALSVHHLPAPDIVFNFMGTPTSPTGRVLIGARATFHGREIQLFNTHLQAFFIIQHSSDHHPAQREEVKRILSSSTLPTIVGGDFNTAPGEGTVAEIESSGYKTVQDHSITWKRMPYVLDHLFYNSGWTLIDHAIIPTDASDHDILAAQFLPT